MMINWLEPSSGPRDVTQITPHAHPDFEQCSLVLEGEYVHHLRWPWTTNLLDWRDDDHQVCRSPSVTVIPPTSIHTSQAIGQGTNQASAHVQMVTKRSIRLRRRACETRILCPQYGARLTAISR